MTKALPEVYIKESKNMDKAHLEELRKNFAVESTELSMHKWATGEAPAPYESPVLCGGCEKI